MDREFYENFGALDKGVMLPSCNLKEELARMPPEEARKTKRKWRKLKRKARGLWSSMTKKDANFVARRVLSDHGRKLFERDK